ncbi:MAG: hypothetical protein IJ770_02800 [Alphaproteobacteria bacterium]|nr:hypothetical protein [Alphaproteobacteria bacterium]
MPQLELSSYFSQAFWLLLSFCTLWFLLSVFIVPKLADVIERRKRKIDEYLQKAENLNAKAQESLDKYRKTLDSAEKQAQEEIQHGKDELKAYLQKTESDLTAALNQKIADNEFMLATEKTNTLQQIEIIAEDLAFQIVQKLGFINISRRDIADIAQKGKTNG